MPLYRNAGTNLPQMANSAMSSATHAMANQTRQTTTVRKKEGNFWDDLYKGARAIGSLAGAANDVAGAVDKGIDLYDKVKVKSAYDDIARTFQDGGFDALQNNPDLLGDYHHSLALGKFFQDRSNSEKGRQEMFQKMDEAAERQYQDFRLGAMGVQQAWDKKDINGFNNGMIRLMGSFPSPYKYEVDANGNFNELFRSDKDMGWTATGRTFTGQQMLDNMQGILRGEQMVLRGVDMKLMPYNEAFIRVAKKNYWNTVIGNQNKRADPASYRQLYDRQGNPAGTMLLQNPWQGFDGASGYGLNAQAEIFDRNGKLRARVDGYDQVLGMGLTADTPKAARAGAGHGEGKTGGGGTASGFAVKDSSLFTKFATGTDPNSGEKLVDHRLAALLENVQRKTGKTGNAIIAAFEENTRRAMEQGMSQEQAQTAVMNIMAQRLNEGAQQNKKSPQQGTQKQPANTGGAGVAGAVRPDNPAIARIQKAAVDSDSRERDPNSVAGAQQGVLDFLEWFRKQPRGASNNFGEEYE